MSDALTALKKYRQKDNKEELRLLKEIADEIVPKIKEISDTFSDLKESGDIKLILESPDLQAALTPFLSFVAPRSSSGGGGSKKHVSDNDIKKLLAFCSTPRTVSEIVKHVGFTVQTIGKKCKKLIDDGKMELIEEKGEDMKYQTIK